MTTSEPFSSLRALLSELTHGTAPTGGVVLNRGDLGLLASLDGLTAADASRSSHGGASIAAHVAHVSYGISLMNRWAAGEDPFASADWNAAWQVGTVTTSDWERLRAALRAQLDAWRDALGTARTLEPQALSLVMGSVVHLAYHIGAIRQIHAGARGPRESEGAA